MASVRVPAEFSEFMQYVVEMLDSGETDDRALVDIDDGLQCDRGYGGREGSRFRFTYFPEDRNERWTFLLSEDEVRDVAGGDLATLEAEVETLAAKPPRREPTSRGRRWLEALVTAGLVRLRPSARLEDVGRVLERAAWDAFDDEDLDDEGRGAAISDALVDLSGVEDVFGEGEELVRVLRPFVLAE